MSTMVAIPEGIELKLETMPKTEVTPEELLAMPNGGHYELIDGELRERNVSALSNLIAWEISGILRGHCREHDLGWLFAADHGYRCFPWKPRLVRRADVAFIRKERYPWEQLSADGYTTIPPDLAVEVVSPNDLASEIEEKVEEYLRAGVRLVWVIHPETRVVQVIRGDGTGNRLRAQDELSGEDVVPGFRCRVADVFPIPSHTEAEAPEVPVSAPETPRS
jgi:Uma2 family endonuclease